MSRYIDLESLPIYEELFMKGRNDSGVWVRYRDVERLLRTAPTVDAVEVVRCKDCENVDEDDLATHRKLCFCFYHGEYQTKDYFCASGKRRKDNDNL